MIDVVSVGNATMDAFVQINPAKHYRKRGRAGEVFFSAGSKIEVESLQFFSGGSATNTAVSFARQGLKAACLCQIGFDEFGNEVYSELAREGVNRALVIRSKNVKTAFSVILTGHGLNRVIFAFGGAARKLDENKNQINWKQLEHAKWVYLGSLHSSLSLVKRIADFCTKKQIGLAWNPGQSELKFGLKKLKPILKQVSVLFLNSEEAQQLMGHSSYRDNLRALAQFVPLNVASLGPVGAAAFDGAQFFFERAHKAQKADATGAGDAFNSGFLSEWIRNKPVSRCLYNGVCNATSVIQYLGAKNKLIRKRK